MLQLFDGKRLSLFPHSRVDCDKWADRLSRLPRARGPRRPAPSRPVRAPRAGGGGVRRAGCSRHPDAATVFTGRRRTCTTRRRARSIGRTTTTHPPSRCCRPLRESRRPAPHRRAQRLRPPFISLLSLTRPPCRGCRSSQTGRLGALRRRHCRRRRSPSRRRQAATTTGSGITRAAVGSCGPTGRLQLARRPRVLPPPLPPPVPCPVSFHPPP